MESRALDASAQGLRKANSGAKFFEDKDFEILHQIIHLFCDFLSPPVFKAPDHGRLLSVADLESSG